MLSADELMALLQRPPAERDRAWMVRFSEVALDTGLMVADPPVNRGQDGFDYYQMRVPRPGVTGPWQTLRSILQWCTDVGTGCVILDGAEPKFVFYYAHLWALREVGMLYDPDELEEPSRDQPDREVLTVAPGASFLPAYARKVLREVLLSVGVDRPEVVLAIQTAGRPSRGLGFNVYPESFSTAEEYEDVMESLRWYVRHDVGVVDGKRLPGMTAL